MGAVGACRPPIHDRTGETPGGAVDRVLVPEVAVGLAHHQTRAIASTAPQGVTARMARGFAHRGLVAVSLRVRLADRALRADSSLNLPVVTGHDRLGPLAPRARKLCRATFLVDAGMGCEAPGLRQGAAMRPKGRAVDRAALVRVIATKDEPLAVAAGHLARMGLAEGGRPRVSGFVQTGADGIARGRGRKAADHGVLAGALDPFVDARAWISEGGSVVRVSAACDPRALLGNGRERHRLSRRTSSDGRSPHRRLDARGRARGKRQPDNAQRGQKPVTEGAPCLVFHTAFCLFSFSSDVTSSRAPERRASSIASRRYTCASRRRSRPNAT
jgi:hypothetical protein